MPYQLKDNRWRAEKMIDGRRKTKIFKTKKEAKRWEQKQDLETWKTNTISLGEWATAYLDMAQERFSGKTYEEKRFVFRSLFQIINSDTDVENMTPQLAYKYLGYQARHRSGHAANKDRKNLMAAWNWGIKYFGLPERNPFKVVDKYPEEKQPRYIPPVEHLERILEIEEGEVKVFLLTMLHTAARRGELLRLKWDDIDFERRTVRLSTRKRKGGSLEYDHIPMTQELRDVLSEHKRHTNSIYVFARDNGQPYSARQHLMKRVCKRAGVPYFGFHAIRHLSASIMDRAGIPTATIQAILRHQSRTTTDRYLHSLRGVQADLDNVFGKKEGKIINLGSAKK